MIKKLFGIVLLCIVLLVGGAWLWLFAFGISLKPWEGEVRRILSQKLAANVTFDEARITFRNQIVLTIKGLAVTHTAEEFQGKTFLTLPEMRVAVDLFSLIDKNVNIHVFFQSPDLHLFKNRVHWALETLQNKPAQALSPTEAAQSTEGSRWTVILQNFEVSRGKIFVDFLPASKIQAPPIPLTEIEFQVAFATPEDFSGSLDLNHISISQLMKLSSTGAAQNIISMGKGVLGVHFKGTGFTSQQLIENLDAEGELTLNHVRFSGDAAGNMLQQKSTILKTLNVRPPDQQWSEWVIPFRLRQGVFQFEQNITFYDGDLSLRPQLMLKENNGLKGPVSFTASKGSWAGFVVQGTLKGTLDNPGFSLDDTAIKSQMAKQGLEKAAKGLEDVAKKQLDKRPGLQDKLQRYGIDVQKLFK